MKQKTPTKQNPIKMKSNKHKNKPTYCAVSESERYEKPLNVLKL